MLKCLNNIYSKLGFYKELGKSIVMEGADGAAKIEVKCSISKLWAAVEADAYARMA